MAQEKNNSKVNPVQAALLNDQDFLRRIVEDFCQNFLEEEMKQHLQAHLYTRNREKTWISQWAQAEETEN